MRTFKKIVAAMVMALSIITILALIAGIIGSWFVNAQLRVAGTNLLLSGETTIVTVRQGLNSADTLLDSSISGLTEIQTRAEQIGALAGDNSVIVDRVLQRLDIDIVPAISRATETFAAVEANLLAINEAVAAIDAIPMLRVNVADMPGVSVISDTLDMLEQLRSDVRDFVARVQQQREQIISGAKQFVIEPAINLNGRLQDISGRLSDADTRLASVATQMATLRERLPALLNTITIVLNIFFALSILAFSSLFAHALQYYRCPDDGLKRALSQPCGAQMVPATVIKVDAAQKAKS